MSKEFEVSLRVDDASEIRRYYQQRQPFKIVESLLNRQIYKDGSDMMARVTSEGSGTDQVMLLDFKQDSLDSEIIKDVRESLPLDISEATKESVQSLFGALDYKPYKIFEKRRTTYYFATFHVDIDEYTSPERATVFEIEGQPEAVKIEYAALQERRLLDPQGMPE